MTHRIAAPWNRMPAMLVGMALSTAVVTAFAAAPSIEQTVEDRIRPVGQVRIAGQVADEEPVAQAPAAERTGKEVVDAACAACHSTGAAAPWRTRSTESWAKPTGGARPVNSHARRALGLMALRQHARRCRPRSRT